MKIIFFFSLLFIQLHTIAQQINNATDIAALSQDFIYATKTGDATDSLQHAIATIPFTALTSQLKTDDEKKAFWINLYNGFTQLLLTKDPAKYKSRNSFFKSKQIEVAGKIV